MKLFIILGFVCIAVISGFFLLSHAPQATMPHTQSVSPTVSLAPKKDLLVFVEPSLPISWQTQKNAVENYHGKPVKGTELLGTVTYKSGYLRALANTTYLKNNGWTQDINLSADGPNGSQWGYTKTNSTKQQLVLFSYMNLSFTPPPNQTTCPCEFNIKIFVSDI